MPEEPTPAPAARRRRFAAPGARRFAAGALASFVAVFGVLALRVHDGDDPALAGVAVKAKTTTTASEATTTTSSDPYDASSSEDSSSSGSSDDSSSSEPSGSVSSTPSASTSAS